MGDGDNGLPLCHRRRALLLHLSFGIVLLVTSAVPHPRYHRRSIAAAGPAPNDVEWSGRGFSSAVPRSFFLRCRNRAVCVLDSMLHSKVQSLFTSFRYPRSYKYKKFSLQGSVKHSKVPTLSPPLLTELDPHRDDHEYHDSYRWNHCLCCTVHEFH